jgi:hypothetical protein
MRRLGRLVTSLAVVSTIGVLGGAMLAHRATAGGTRDVPLIREARVPLLRLPTFLGRRRDLGRTFLHPRCTTCHGFHVPNANGQNHINDGRAAQPCSNCHTIPGWHAPPASFDLASKSLGEICDFVKDHVNNDPVLMANHLKGDPLILWAVGDAVLFGTLRPGGKAPPGDLDIWFDRIDRWTAAGMPCE